MKKTNIGLVTLLFTPQVDAKSIELKTFFIEIDNILNRTCHC
jgi:hypothetical protein